MTAPAFEPIAIVGQGCILPGCLTPNGLWQAVLTGRDLTGPPPKGRWSLPEAEVAAMDYRGGFVSGFEKRFRPEGFDLGDVDPTRLDPVCRWLLQAGQDAWRDAGRPDTDPARIAVIAGNLSYPSRALSDFAIDTWLGRDPTADAINRFNSGFPAIALARSLGAHGPRFCLDAACASSLYAIKLACDELQMGRADIAVAGAVTAADSLILHQGFEALQALSPTRRSSPLSAAADGLLPSEGAAAIVLKRLADCGPDERIHGVICGIGLSNDGRRRGLLAPDGDGQREAVVRAWQAAGLDPAHHADFLEGHATGTPVGDGVELASSATLFGDGRQAPLPIGALKANTGHLLAAAGLAGLIKLTLAMRHRTLPPTRLADAPSPAFAEHNSLTVLTEPAPWESNGRRCASLSTFGFGGNNAHLVLTEADGSIGADPTAAPPPRKSERADIVISALAANAGRDRGLTAIARRLMRGHASFAGASERAVADARFARTPPADLAAAQPAQLMVLDVIAQAIDGLDLPPADRIGCYVGIACDPDPARWMLRARLAAVLGRPVTAAERDQAAPPLGPADVLGAMPNMPANRVTAAQDWRGQGFALSAEAASGDAALRVAMTALARGEVDLAIVAAADMAAGDVHGAARSALGAAGPGGDGAAALVLQRRSDTEPSGGADYGTVTLPAAARDQPLAEPPSDSLARTYGATHAASTLLTLAVTRFLAARGLTLSADGVSPIVSASSAKMPAPARPSSGPLRPPAVFAAYTGERRADLLAALEDGSPAKAPSHTATYRLALIAPDASALDALRRQAARALKAGEAPSGPGLFYGEGPADGELAFVFTGSATAYPQMGRGLFTAFPELGPRLAARHPEAEILSPLLARRTLTPFQELCAAVLLSQAQSMLWRDLLGVRPDAAIGLSLGETNALVAFGAWRDAGHLLEQLAADGMYERRLGGRCEIAAEAWGCQPPCTWQSWQIGAPAEEVETAVRAARNRADLTIIYSPEDCLIGGPPEDCRAVLEQVGRDRAVRVSHDLVIHTPAMKPYADTWHRLHKRTTYPVPGVRFYTNAINGAYTPNAQSAADSLTLQALTPIDFRKTVEAAYRDGVRTFLEIGPRGLLTRSIGKILGRRPHRAAATNTIAETDIDQVLHASATVFAAGHAINMREVQARLEAMAAHPWPQPQNEPSMVERQSHSPAPRFRETALSSAPEAPSPRPCSSSKPLAPSAIIPLPEAPALPPVDYAEPSLVPAKTDALPEPAPVANPPQNKPTPKPARPQRPGGSPQPLARRAPTGPSYTREQLERAGSGAISKLFGEIFRPQDGYTRQVRLPLPPLLLVDRITGLEAEPGKPGKGTIWTETDIGPKDWHLMDGLMRPGPLIEAGQADLSLISYMGADLLNRDERVYRLLGCELTLQSGVLPRPGDTLRFQIEITGHAELGGVRMFFFQYDGYVGDRLLHSVRNGQAGFFTDDELAASRGVLWTPEDASPPTESPPQIDLSGASAKRAFTADDLAALRKDDALACFGKGFETCAAHSFPPRLPDDRLALIDDVEVFEPEGGPWGRGYLKARQHVPSNAWFYQGHFHNDPCMPGTLMAEAAVQALELHAMAAGLTRHRDGFVFEPLPGHTAKFLCRGQVIPDRDHDIIYEVFIDRIEDGDTPEIHGALLATCNGLKVFYCPSFALRLRRNWPAIKPSEPPLRIGPSGASRGDRTAMLACSHGAPSIAFGEMYEKFDTSERVPRLPRPPFHMITRMTAVSTEPGIPVRGARASAEFEIDRKAWYFAASGNGAMPYAVLVEGLLQPCGWLASHCGFALHGGAYFRNLDGDVMQHREVYPAEGKLLVDTTLTQFSKIGPMTIVSFDVTARLANGEPVMTLATSFGFFPAEALARQTGLKAEAPFPALAKAEEAALKVRRSGAILPRKRMKMIDRVTWFDPEGGSAGLGALRGHQAVDPYAWYFKAHFFQDPVQPGSLGLDALLQLLMRAAKLKKLDKPFDKPRFESLALEAPMQWRCRGQVTPDRKAVTTLIDLIAVERGEEDVLLRANGMLWCDGLPIYDAKGLAIRVVETG